MTHATIADRLRPAAAAGALAYDVGWVLAGSLLIAAGARVAVPLPGSLVPVTGQTFAVLLVGALLGSRRGAWSVATYLLEGGCGLPVFAGGAAGAAYMLGPTGGYLAGFLPAAWLTGLLAERGWDRRFATAIAAMVVGEVALFAPGTLHLAGFVGWRPALTWGLMACLPGEAFKVTLAAALLPAGWRIAGKTGGPEDRRTG